MLPIRRPQRKQVNRRLEGIGPRAYISLWQHNHNEQSCHSPQIKPQTEIPKKIVTHLMTEFCNYGTYIIFVTNTFLSIFVVVECFTI